jgi:nitroimidazol reductase NimA-like FMN-containing flavoprotein (pyridoxamine 5'-phosphate oxidase superfamily)
VSTKLPSSEDVRAFLNRSWPTMLGVVGTVRPDGSPHIVPVWYRYDDEFVNIITQIDSQSPIHCGSNGACWGLFRACDADN